MIHGAFTTLRPATEADRRSVYEWMAHSEVTPSMMGPPSYTEAPIPTWEEYCADYVDLFFDGSSPENGRSFIIEANGEPIGHISYSQVNLGRRETELDIWMHSENACGHGYGSDALDTLVHHLHETLGLTEFIIRPSRRNQRAIRAYAKAGFVPLPLTTEEQAAIYGPTEHYDTTVMVKKVHPESFAKSQNR